MTPPAVHALRLRSPRLAESAAEIDLLLHITAFMKQKHPFSLLSYTVLDDAFHLTLQHEGIRPLRLLQQLAARYHNSLIESGRGLVRSDYQCRTLATRRSLLETVKYHHLLPVLHDYHPSPDAGARSSYAAYVREENGFIDRESVLQSFPGGTDAFCRFHERELGTAVSSLQLREYSEAYLATLYTVTGSEAVDI
ncbi:hypothetical protein [Alkalicoccus luteus]|uniref:hypothetical protein n=1 Tax=Alkalicoccus luteus TaxID=1237094 RepID=UPI004033D6FA